MLKNLLGIVSMLLFCSFAVQEQDKQSFGSMLSDAAIELTKIRVIYDPNYYVLDYPNGDLPADRGVCTDVVVRAYRKLGIDLQKEVHEDMKANFHLYPNN